jgi:RNA polymerase sigma-70 factor (ECF subfamily)
MNLPTTNLMPVVELVPLDGSTIASGGETAGRTGGATGAASFERAVSEHHAAIRKLVFRLLGWSSDAEDVLQDVYLKAWRSWDKFRGESQARTWLTRIAINQCRSHQRRKQLGLGLLARLWSGVGSPAAPAANQRAEQSERATQVRSAVQRLRPRDREIIVLHYLEELPVVEVAELLKVARGAVEVRLSRARKRLRSVMDEMMNEKR